MPIITPAYPQQNSTFNVSQSTLSIMTEEFKRGFDIIEKLYNSEGNWDLLFEPMNFFNKYRHYITIIATCKTDIDRLEWVGLVESKIRLLVKSLEDTEGITVAHVNPKQYEGNNQKEPQTLWFIGLDFEKLEHLKVDLTYEIQQFVNTVQRQGTQSGVFKDGMKVEATYLKKKQLGMLLPPSVIKLSRKRSSQVVLALLFSIALLVWFL
jgi:poly(A) polymerase